MKKLAMTLLAALLLTAPAAAQFYPDGRPIHPAKRGSYYGGYSGVTHHSYRAPQTYGGFRVGLGVATVNSDSPVLDTNSARAGLNIGVAVGVQVAPSTPLFFESGLYYTQKGGTSKVKGEKFSYDLDYLELPLLLKYKIPVDGGLTVDPFLGGYLACGVGGKIKDYNNREAYSSFSDDFYDNFKRFDGGLKVGCGLSYDMLYLEASYDFGLANVGKDAFDDTHTGDFNLTVGINF